MVTWSVGREFRALTVGFDILEEVHQNLGRVMSEPDTIYIYARIIISVRPRHSHRYLYAIPMYPVTKVHSVRYQLVEFIT